MQMMMRCIAYCGAALRTHRNAPKKKSKKSAGCILALMPRLIEKKKTTDIAGLTQKEDSDQEREKTEYAYTASLVHPHFFLPHTQSLGVCVLETRLVCLTGGLWLAGCYAQGRSSKLGTTCESSVAFCTSAQRPPRRIDSPTNTERRTHDLVHLLSKRSICAMPALSMG